MKKKIIYDNEGNQKFYRIDVVEEVIEIFRKIQHNLSKIEISTKNLSSLSSPGLLYEDEEKINRFDDLKKHEIPRFREAVERYKRVVPRQLKSKYDKKIQEWEELCKKIEHYDPIEAFNKRIGCD